MDVVLGASASAEGHRSSSFGGPLSPLVKRIDTAPSGVNAPHPASTHRRVTPVTLGSILLLSFKSFNR